MNDQKKETGPLKYTPQIFTGARNAKVKERVIVDGVAKERSVKFLFEPKVALAIDVALAARRPLLVAGPPGCGKSSLAEAIASGLKARSLSRTITSRTKIDDLFAEVDTLQRLSDAQLSGENSYLRPPWAYLRPGLLWWAFNPESAKTRGATNAELKEVTAKLQSGQEKLKEPENPTEGRKTSDDVVVLLDEIDKADPDLPNDLLEPLDKRSFSLPLADRPKVSKKGEGRVVLVLTTNGERDLPSAFVRRCVTLNMEEPRSKKVRDELGLGGIALEDIAASHFRGADPKFKALFSDVADDLEELRKQADKTGLRRPSTAEYLDTLRALSEAPNLRSPEQVWAIVQDLLLLKRPGSET